MLRCPNRSQPVSPPLRLPAAAAQAWPRHVPWFADPVWQACHAQHVQEIAAADVADDVGMQAGWRGLQYRS